ncbi:MAG: hypothetical protein HOQ32_19110 [Lysobacter sp.]|nr:hypothetical protein [Lysobacter sp.]
MKSVASRLVVRSALATLLCASTLPASAACLGATPLQAAHAWFERHYTFWNDPPAVLQANFAPPLLALLLREQTCSEQGVCAIGADPWLDAQDGEARDPQFQVETAGEGASTVRLRYRFVLDDGAPAPTQEVRLRFSGEARCWRASDLIGPDGRSLVQSLREYHGE